ncbi:HAD-superfamily phosphatase [Nemania abortiva]|nr:HAD-superfamily phosphatase [Nemania abortiva]
MNLNLNLSGFLNVFKLAVKPSLCLPHATVSTFSDLPSPLDRAFEAQGKKCNIKAVVLDKDDCFAYPDTNEIYPAYAERFQQLRKEYPGHRLLIVSNTAGATTYDRDGRLAKELETATGVPVLAHRVKKPGCKDEIMAHFKKYPETGVTHPSEVVVIGDRLMTDMMLANMMGSWGIWIKDGVKPMSQKSIFSKFEQRLGPMLMARGLHAPDPRSPFD